MIKAICRGNRKSKMIFGNPIPAFLLVTIYKFAGKTAISNAIIHHAANSENKGMQRAIPKIISAKPDKPFSNLVLGRYLGIIFRYILGFIK